MKAATDAVQSFRQRFRRLRLHGEVVGNSARAALWHLIARHAALPKLLDGRVDVRRMARPQQGRDIPGNPRCLAGMQRLDRDGVKIRDAQRVLQRGVRNERHLDLVRIRRVGDADDGERLLVDGDRLPDGLCAGAKI